VIVVLVAVVAAYVLTRTPGGEASDDSRQAALTRAHAPSLGDAGAKVHIVEFLDPACETCAQFYPLVKQLIAQNPGRIRLSVRHVPFHQGSEHAVRALEASRKQDKYWQTLEALLGSQGRWTRNHTVMPDMVLPAIAGVGLDMEQLASDMQAPEVSQRMDQDFRDATTLKVTATPEYFVNGRPLPSFGYEQLMNLVNEELQKAY
jgi:protein-disulfide isomerase